MPDHDFRDCAERVEVKPGMYTVETCDACRKWAYSLEDPEWSVVVRNN